MYSLGIDIGTSSVKAIVADENGTIAGSGTAEYPVHSPRPGWSEQEPADWWRGTVAAVRQAMAEAGVSGGEVAGIGLSGQMHGSVFLDASGRSIRRAILWNDQRTHRECDAIVGLVGGKRKLLALVANPAFTGFTAPKILWLRSHNPGQFNRVRQILLPKDYLRYRLTGEFATDVTDASGTLLLDVARRRWSKPMFDALDLDPGLFPPVFESTEVTGVLAAKPARELGLSAGIPVAGGGGDQAMGAVGNGIVEPGLMSAMMGTSGVMFAHTDRMQRAADGQVHTFCHAVPGSWHTMSCMLSAGGMLQWFARTLCRTEQADARRRGADVYDLILQRAAEVSPGAEGLYCLPYLTGERTPFADPFARGCFIGLTPRHTHAMMARAVVEGITYGMLDSLNVMRGMGVPVSQICLSGGGAKSHFWCQLQADIYGVECCTTNATAGSAYGATLTGGVAAGMWKSIPEACHAAIHIQKRYRPRKRQADAYRRLYRPFNGLYMNLKNSFAEMAQVGGNVE